MINDTIVALATPPLKSALAIIRVSGQDSFAIVQKIFSKNILDIKERTLLVGKISFNDKLIDDVVIALYKNPHSFTGEDLIEIICHGSMLIVNEILSALIASGARMATNGEYSERAFLNKKIDLIQAEAINDVINSISEEAKALSLKSLEGETTKLVKPIKDKIADILSLIEVNIDYPEYEDIEKANKEKIIKTVDDILSNVLLLIDEGNKGKLIKDGINVAIVGSPNVGKSTLLNVLLGEEKAIVTPIAGTTRDIVEGDVNIGGLTLHLMDTAGIHLTSDTIEGIGIKKSVDAINKADLVLVLLDVTNQKEDEQIIKLTSNSNRILVYNKADLTNKNIDGVMISALNKDIDALKKAIFAKFGIEDKNYQIPSLNNARQLALLHRVKESLLKAKEDASNDAYIDLIAVNLSEAYQACLELLGEDNTLDFSKEIFSRFCVGK